MGRSRQQRRAKSERGRAKWQQRKGEVTNSVGRSRNGVGPSQPQRKRDVRKGQEDVSTWSGGPKLHEYGNVSSTMLVKVNTA